MTTGHKHRHLKVKKGGLIFRVLRKPLWYTRDVDRVDASPYPYGLSESRGYYLSLLGVLHRWTGLTLDTRSKQ